MIALTFVRGNARLRRPGIVPLFVSGLGTGVAIAQQRVANKIDNMEIAPSYVDDFVAARAQTINKDQ